MSSKPRGGTLRQLLLGNLLIYLVAGGLAVYFFIQPPADDSEAPASITGNVSGGPFLNLVLPTPTAFARPAKNVFPSPTAVPLLASAQTNVSAENIGPTPAPQAVTDNSLVPPTALNILLLGTDRRNASDASWRTDTIILLSVNQQAKSVGLLSIPRDLWVKIPGYGYERINTADFYGDFYKYPGGGQQLIKDVVELNLGIRIHYYARVDMKVFRSGIDTLGGVDVDVTCPVVENGFSDDLGYVNLNFQPGVQHMDGATALRYARSRYTTSDYDRSRRQRQVILAAWDKAKQMNLLPKWPELYDQFRTSVKTDLGPTELATLAWIGSQLRPDHIKSRAIDNRVLTPWMGPEGQAVQLLIAQKVHALLVEFFTPPDARQETASDENASIEVLSGTGSKQTADLAAVALSHQGFNVVSSNITQTHINATTLVVYNGAKVDTISRLMQLLGIPVANIRTIIDPDSHVDLQLVLGRDYNPCAASK
jgi:LCP family protein required for cell wall assembly